MKYLLLIFLILSIVIRTNASSSDIKSNLSENNFISENVVRFYNSNDRFSSLRCSVLDSLNINSIYFRKECANLLTRSTENIISDNSKTVILSIEGWNADRKDFKSKSSQLNEYAANGLILASEDLNNVESYPFRMKTKGEYEILKKDPRVLAKKEDLKMNPNLVNLNFDSELVDKFITEIGGIMVTLEGIEELEYDLFHLSLRTPSLLKDFFSENSSELKDISSFLNNFIDQSLDLLKTYNINSFSVIMYPETLNSFPRIPKTVKSLGAKPSHEEIITFQIKFWVVSFFIILFVLSTVFLCNSAASWEDTPLLYSKVSRVKMS